MLIHVAKASTLTGSRVLFQMSLAEPSEFYQLEKRVRFIPGFINLKLILRLLNSVGGKIIFHQHIALPTMLLAYVFNRLFRRQHTLVYDVHDLLYASSEIVTNRLLLYLLLEYFASKLRINWITVSSFHRKSLKHRYGIDAGVVYNLTSNRISEGLSSRHTHTIQRSCRQGVVYFGVLSPDRIELRDVEYVVSEGFSFSLHGRWFDEGNKMWRGRLEKLVFSSGGSVYGEYSPSDLSFLNAYQFLLINYRSASENIQGCLPNKLFQALNAGLICICSREMREVWRIFGETGFLAELSELHCKSQAEMPGNSEQLSTKLSHLVESSRRDYKLALRYKL